MDNEKNNSSKKLLMVKDLPKDPVLSSKYSNRSRSLNTSCAAQN